MASSGVGFSNSITELGGFNLFFKPSIAFTTAKIDQLGMSLESFKEPITKSILEVMKPSILENFTSGGRPKWDTLSKKTIAKRMKAGTGITILMETKNMFNNVTAAGNWAMSNTTAVYTGKALNAAAPYAKYHQSGTGGKGKKIKREVFKKGDVRTIKRGGNVSAQQILADIKNRGGNYTGVPARPFLMFQEEDKIKIQAIFAEWLGEQVKLHWVK